MKHTVQLTVALRITDNEARSALEAIQEKMGLRDRVRDLVREDLWEIGVEAGSPDEARAAVDGIVRTTNIFANPNKHRYSIAGGDGNAPSLDGDEFAILVSDREGAESQSVMAAVHRTGSENVASVRRWTRWRVRLAGGAVRGDPELIELIRRIAVATGRHDGLLSNPHSQTSRVLLPWGEEKVLAA